MILETHPDLRLRKLTIGRSRHPPGDRQLHRRSRPAGAQSGGQTVHGPIALYPGIRAEAPPSYRQLIETRLKDVLFEHFGLQGRSLRFSMSHYSLVTTPPEKLAAIQRIPHVDSLNGSGLATIHYLFKTDLGGTAFTGTARRVSNTWTRHARTPIFRSLESENEGPDMPVAEYINGNTALFEQIASEDGVFNRMLVYRRNSLHSGCIAKGFVPDPNPLTGRLSVNCFIDAVA